MIAKYSYREFVYFFDTNIISYTKFVSFNMRLCIENAEFVLLYDGSSVLKSRYGNERDKPIVVNTAILYHKTIKFYTDLLKTPDAQWTDVHTALFFGLESEMCRSIQNSSWTGLTITQMKTLNKLYATFCSLKK